MHLLNTTTCDIIQHYDGSPYVFPAGKSVLVEDDRLANWFIGKMALPKSPKAGRPSEVLRLAPVKTPTTMASQQYRAPPPPPGEPGAPSEQLPPARQNMPPPPPKVQANFARAALSKIDKGMLVLYAQKHGVWKKGMDKPVIVEALAGIGFMPPNV